MATLAHNLVNGPQVDLSLAAARDPMEQEAARLQFRVFDGPADLGQGFFLVIGQRVLMSAVL